MFLYFREKTFSVWSKWSVLGWGVMGTLGLVTLWPSLLKSLLQPWLFTPRCIAFNLAKILRMLEIVEIVLFCGLFK